MTDTKDQPQTSPGPTPPSIVKQLAPQDNALQIRGDRIDEMAAWLSNMRYPGAMDTRFPHLIAPESIRITDIEKHMPNPSRVRKKIKFIDTSSFVEYFNLFKAAYQPLLVTKRDDYGMMILCVFDYDGPGVTIPNEKEGAAAVTTAPVSMWNDHQATLACQYGPDYKALKANDSKWFSQEDFALFVEENTHLFVNPDGATMLELAQELKGMRSASWQSGKRLSNNQVGLQYIETVNAQSVRGEISVPEYLEMTMPIFDGYEASAIRAAFRWKMEGNTVKFSYRLLTKIAEREALDAVKQEIVKLTGKNLFSVSDFDGVTTGGIYVRNDD